MSASLFSRLLAVPLAVLVLAPPAPAAELAPGNPPLTQEIVDLRRDAVEAVFDVQLTARQLREHQRLYAWCWKYATADWQKAEARDLPAFRGVFDQPPAARKTLRDKHLAAWTADAKARAEKGSPYHLWLLSTTTAAAGVIADGPPALRRDTLDNTLEFIQWGLRMQLTVRQQEDFLRQIPREWNVNLPKETRDSIVNEFLPVYRKVVRLAPSDRTAFLKAVEPLLLDALKKPESPLDRWLAAAHAEANQVLADGPPDALTAGGTDQHADFYDWALGLRLSDAVRKELRGLILKDWKEHPNTRSGSLSTSRLMDDPPKGGVGELRRLDDAASTLFFIVAQKENVVNRAAMDEYRRTRPTARPVPPLSPKVLVAADPPLTEGDADGNVKCFEWIFGFAFTAEESAELRRLQVKDWPTDTKEGRQGTLTNAFLYTQLASLTPEDEQLVRAYCLPDVLKMLRDAKPDMTIDKYLLERYTARHPSVVPGKPGPSQAEVDALKELLRFRAMEVSGGNKAAAEKVVAGAVEKVTKGDAAVADVQKARFQLVALRRAWPTLTETDRQELRDRWADDLRLLGLPVKLAAWQTTPAPSRELASLDAMRKLQQQQQTTAMISNMMRIQHQTNMAVIRNMGSTPYRYEYKYEYRRR